MMPFKTILVMTAMLLIVAFILFKCRQNEKEFIQSVEQTESVIKTPVHHYRDNGGTDHAEKPVAEASLKVIEASYKKTIDSLTGLLKIKPKQVNEIVQAGTLVESYFRPDINYIPNSIPFHDTINICGDTIFPSSIEINYQDAWLTLRGVLNEDSSWHYSLRDSLSFITYKKKTGFLKRELFLDAFSMNPGSTITGLTAIKITEARPKKWAVALFGGYGWNGKQWGLVGGAGLTRNLVRF